MNEFFFVKIDNLAFVPADKIPSVLEAAAPFMPDKACHYLITMPHNGSESLVAITADKLYFMEIVSGGRGRAVSRLKCFHKRGMMAHALITGSEKELPQIRIMMDNNLKLQFELGQKTDESDKLIAAVSACEFFA